MSKGFELYDNYARQTWPCQIYVAGNPFTPHSVGATLDKDIPFNIFANHSFAFAERLCREIGGQVVYLVTFNGTECYYHYAMVSLGANMYIDALGIWEKRKFIEFWRDNISNDEENSKREFWFIRSDEKRPRDDQDRSFDHIVKNIHGQIDWYYP